MSNFVECGRDQAFLLPPDLRDWLPADDPGHFVIEAVERVDLGAFKVNHRGTGSAQYHPRMMLALMIYCYANGIFSSRRVERATHRDIGVRFVAANTRLPPGEGPPGGKGAQGRLVEGDTVQRRMPCHSRRNPSRASLVPLSNPCKNALPALVS